MDGGVWASQLLRTLLIGLCGSLFAAFWIALHDWVRRLAAAAAAAISASFTDLLSSTAAALAAAEAAAATAAAVLAELTADIE